MLPKMGKELHQADADAEFADRIATALTSELGTTHQAIKTAMRWTGASERSVKHWFAGTHAPSGRHLVALIRHSDTVLASFLNAAGRNDLIIGLGIVALRLKLRELLAIMDDQIVQETTPTESHHIIRAMSKSVVDPL